MRDTFVRVLLEEAQKDPNIFLITGDLGFGVLEEFELLLPNQFLNAGVAEQTMLSLAGGMASTGKRVFVYSIGNFPTIRALEQIRNDICYMNNPVVVVAVGSGYSYGAQGYTHHALEDIATIRALPNIDVLSPSDPFETEIVTKFLVNSRKPSYLRLGRSGEEQLNLEFPKLENGKLNMICEGKDGAILFTGSIGINAIRAREELLEQGIEVAVFSVPFISTLQASEFDRLPKGKNIVVLEEHSIRGGLCSALLELAAENRKEFTPMPLAVNDNQLSIIGDQNYLRESHGLGIGKIVSFFMKNK